MNFQFYKEKLESSKEFENFKKEHQDAFLSSGFFVLDFENLKNPDDKSHLDFYIPSENKIFSFELEKEIQLVPVKMFENSPVPEKLIGSSVLDFDEIEKMIRNEMAKKDIKNKIQKIIMVIQNKNGKDFWICTVFISGLGLLKVNIDDLEKRIILFEKKSFVDMMNVFKKKK